MKRLMKINAFLFLILVFSGTLAFGQGIYLLPDPTNVGEPARLYVNTASADCQCDELADAGPDNPIYIWTWLPLEARSPIVVDGETKEITNGAWENSNENLRMTQDENNPSLWFYDFLGVPLTDFYGVPPADFYSGGIHFLIKEKSGAAIDGAEQKSADLSIVPESPGCVLKLCTFPTIWYATDYLTLTYDNNQETVSSLQNMNEGEALVWFRYKVNGGPFQVFQDPEAGVMEFQGGGFFSITMIPQEFFGLEENDILDEIQVYFTKPPIVAPPFSTPISLFPGCPE